MLPRNINRVLSYIDCRGVHKRARYKRKKMLFIVGNRKKNRRFYIILEHFRHEGKKVS